MTLNFGEATARAAEGMRRKRPNPEDVEKALRAIKAVLDDMSPSSPQNPAPSHGKGAPANDAEVQRFKRETKTPERQPKRRSKQNVERKTPQPIGPQL